MHVHGLSGYTLETMLSDAPIQASATSLLASQPNTSSPSSIFCQRFHCSQATHSWPLSTPAPSRKGNMFKFFTTSGRAERRVRKAAARLDAKPTPLAESCAATALPPKDSAQEPQLQVSIPGTLTLLGCTLS